MNTTRALRQAAAHAERTPLIKFVGRHSIPSTIDHSPQPHPASPSGKLPDSFSSSSGSDKSSRFTSFSSYRDQAQQHGPLQKSVRPGESIGTSTGAELGSVAPPKGVFFDVTDLPKRFRRAPIDMAEIEAVESGGAAMLG